ncbi:MAG: TrbI/VirB10 family protein [Treponema sp.]|nr:TrbI/VirB10 family protein [Treponema sp.]
MSGQKTHNVFGEAPASSEQDQSYETTPESVTGFGKGAHPGIFNRKKVMIVISISFAIVVIGGMLININSSASRQREQDAAVRTQQVRPPPGFLQGQLNRAAASMQNQDETIQGDSAAQTQVPASELPVMTWADDSPAARLVPPPPSSQARQAPPPPPQPAAHSPPPRPTHYLSPIVPQLEGRLLASANSPSSPPTTPQPFTSSPPQAWFGANSTAAPASDGHFLEDNSLWIGTVIPAVLITAINTDLPGNILARVSENVFDSRTGSVMLIPQGSILFARYGGDVSFAQSRVQIAWDTLIRPDGFQLDLGGMGGVDRTGMAGQEAVHHGNWFQYLQAAGLIAMFSVANARMTEEAARHTNEAVAGNIAQANTEFVSQVGGQIVSRAMNVQPTLTVDSGTSVNVMINRNISLPPLNPFPIVQRHRLE